MTAAAVPEPAWPLVRRWLKEAKRKVEILSEEGGGQDTLAFLRVSDRSPLGAVALHTGGIVVDDGLVRVLGAGCPRMKSGLVAWNTNVAPNKSGGFLLVAHDALGGFFLLNGGMDPDAEQGECLYLAPDTLEIERMKTTYSGFLQFCCGGDLETFYSFAQWPGRHKEVTHLGLEQGLSFYPFLWTKEGKDPEKSSRRAVPMTELWHSAWDLRAQLRLAD